MKYNRVRNPGKNQQPKRKLKTKPLLILIGLLLICNVLWFVGWLIPDKVQKDEEAVASVAKEVITREEWMTAMEKEVGREVLMELVNEKVMEVAAKKYKIDVSDEEIDLELSLIQSVDGGVFTGLDEKKLRQRIRSNLILEKVLTKDVVIQEEAIESHYQENATLYNLPTAYRTAIIVLSSREDAEQALKELSSGSSFDVLAKESSIDLGSASLGGDIGYIHNATGNIDTVIRDTVSSMKEGAISEVVALTDGTYAILSVEDIMKGQNFELKEVKNNIRRQLAMDQLPQSVNPEAFWKEFDAKWFYGE